MCINQFWDHPRLRQEYWRVGQRHPQLSAIRSASQHFAAFVDTLGDRLSAKRRGCSAEQILARIPALPAQRAKDAGAWRCALGELPLPTQPNGPLRCTSSTGRSGTSIRAWVTLLTRLPYSAIPNAALGWEQPLVRRYHDRLLAYDVLGLCLGAVLGGLSADGDRTVFMANRLAPF